MANGKEAFAINYGSVAIGTEIWANRIPGRPAANAVDAKFEEFFLSSWVGGDPADRGRRAGQRDARRSRRAETARLLKAAASRAQPSTAQVIQRPQGDRRLLSGRPVECLSQLPERSRQVPGHARRTEQSSTSTTSTRTSGCSTPASNESKLLDSQTITPGDGFTLEMIYGSGNRNLTPGDSIFHCHFYPHFAGGTLGAVAGARRVRGGDQAGARQDGVDRPHPGRGRCPTARSPAGTPIPALVPMPTLPMAPIPPAVKLVAATLDGPAGRRPRAPAGLSRRAGRPGAKTRGKNPGYPFFIPGIAGTGAPQPPLDFARDELTGQPLDGGLPRHVVLGRHVALPEAEHARLLARQLSRDAQRQSRGSS